MYKALNQNNVFTRMCVGVVKNVCVRMHMRAHTLNT